MPITLSQLREQMRQSISAGDVAVVQALMLNFQHLPVSCKTPSPFPSQSFLHSKPQNDCLAKTLSFEPRERRYGQAVSLTQAVEDILTNLSIH
jgi:hypothetical protein